MCWFRDVPAGSLTDRRSQLENSALALSPVDGPHDPGNQISQISYRTSTGSSEPGDDLAAPRAHQQPIQDH
jgi:hypothetical protein